MPGKSLVVPVEALPEPFRSAHANRYPAQAREPNYGELIQPGLETLQMICDGLNAKPKEAVNMELRRLITAWQASGPNLAKMLAADPELHRQLTTELRPSYLPTQTGRAIVLFDMGGHADPSELNSDARARFMMITISPEWRKFGGPCPRCGRFFIRKTAKASVFCSPRHASQASAIERTSKVREERHADKLRLAKAAQAEWSILLKKGRTKKAWKEWVASRHPDITTKFLTRAVNNGELNSPESERRTHVKK